MSAKLIPAKEARIFWNDEPGSLLRAGGPEVLILGGENRRDDDPQHLSCSAGALGREWMVGGHALDTPAGVFAAVWLCRGAAPASIRSALVQFGQIAECGWAREMLAAFDYRDGLA